MPDQDNLYRLSRGERAVFSEIYFPKKGVYQGTIFDALEKGLDEEEVKVYLREEVKYLLAELKDYHNLLNPCQYEEASRVRTIPLTKEEAVQRINMYISTFRGWSMYEVDGVWKANGGVDEERTQVVRIMFRLSSAYSQEAEAAGCSDVLRSILFWCISQQGNLDEYALWGKEAQKDFISRHRILARNKVKLAFAKQYFAPVAKEVDKWRDDCALFVFGYLVKKFSEQVIFKGGKEKEIWVASFFNLTINVFKELEQLTQA